MVKKINFKCTFCGLSFTPMSKCRKRPWNLYKYKNSFLKTYFSLIIEYGMYLKCLQKPRCLVGSKQAKRSDPIRSSKDNVIAKSFRLSTKRKLGILLNFFFPFVSFIGVVSIFKCKGILVKMMSLYQRWSQVFLSLSLWARCFLSQTYVGRTFCFPSLTGTNPVCFIGDTVRARPVKL